jgi:oligoribonuclease NrnB/cAMP/cGMP phosphodiesterase (DHH superfamily)
MSYFTLEQLRNIKTVVSHGNNCPDGVASAMIVADAYRYFHEEAGTTVEILVIDHQSEEKAKLEAKPGMLFVDFSPPEERAQEFIDAGTLCLDHHKKGSSVQAFVRAGLGVFGDEDKDPGVCGAVLAYEHVWKPLKAANPSDTLELDPMIVQEFARLSGIRDTWQTKSPDWIKACKMAEALRFWPLATLLVSPPEFWKSHIDLGEILWARKIKTVTKISEHVYNWTSPRGTRVAIFQGVKFSSDVAEALGDAVDLIVAYDIAYEPGHEFKLICSSRSRASYDCGALALAYGGGGHTRAAGFNRPMGIDAPNPYQMVQLLVAAHEATLPRLSLGVLGG